MGVVIKQSFWGSALAYLGVFIGFFNTIVLRPAYMDMGEIGLISLIVSNALLVAPFVTSGMPATYIRYFPFFKDDKSLNDKFYSFQLFTVLTACIITGIAAYIGQDQIQELFSDKSPVYNQYIFVSLFILIFHSLFLQLHAYSRVNLDIILPNALKEVFLRVGNIVFILLFAFGQITLDQLIRYLVVLYALSFLTLLVYLYIKYPFKITLKFLDLPKEWIKKMFYFGGYNLLLAGSNSIYANINFLLIPVLIGTEANGVFTTCFYIGIIVEMPKRSMVQIISPIISREFKNENYGEIDNLYKKASQTLATIATLFMIGIACNLDDLFGLIPQGSTISTGYYIVLAVAFAKVVDLSFSFNSELLIYSKHYKWNLYYFLATAVLMGILSYWWIGIWGINGAALAYFVSTVFFNVIKHLFIIEKFKLSPFTINHIYLMIFALILGALFLFLPLTTSPVLNIVIRSILITLFYVIGIYKLKISPDINRLIQTMAGKYLKLNI